MKRPVARFLAAVAAALIGTAATGYWIAPWMVDTPALPPVESSVVTDRHGELLGLLPGADNYRREPLPEGALPPDVVRALLAIEDKRFFSHGGIDPMAVARAAYGHLRGTSKSGASTLTMQLAKLAQEQESAARGLPRPPRTMRNKIRECLRARQWEMAHDKEWVLREYLDRADFGNLCQGIETAARFYFGKHAHELDVAQAALLVGLVQAPAKHDPLRHPESALTRRNRILAAMGEPTDAPLGVQAHDLSVPNHLTDRPGRLTLDAPLQRACREVARKELEKLRHKGVSQASVVVLDNRTGEVLVRIGAALPESGRGGKLDGTTTPRSAGSTLKPFVYCLAFAKGAWPGTVMADVPTLYRAADGVQAPANYNNRYMGPIPIRLALACSQNVPAMEALNLYTGGKGGLAGVQAFLDLLHRLGYSAKGDASEFGLGLAIGNAHVTLLEQVRAYSALARGGTLPPLLTTLPAGDSTPAPAAGEPVLDPRHCYLISDILGDRNARAAAFGPASALTFRFPCSCKTGTSSNYRDNWCIGYTAEYTVGVWCGNFDNSPMYNVSGVTGAGPIFHGVFELLAERERQHAPKRPEGIVEVEIDTRTGLPPTDSTPGSCRRKELCTQDSVPTEPGRYDDQGRALLDSRYAEWYKTAGSAHLYALDTASAGPRLASILIPAQGSTVVLDPTLPNQGRDIVLRSTVPEAVAVWHCDTLLLYRSDDGHWHARLTPGEHSLYVENPETGHSAHATFTVISRLPDGD